VATTQLPKGEFSRELVGADHGGVAVSVIFVDAKPGDRVGLHRHPYPEVFFVLEGEAVFDDGTTEVTVASGHVVIVPANQEHGFTNASDAPLRQIDVHLSGQFMTEWLTE
jgi:mannose-6-phosphate isomerase-like protein (cupin superfamily)